MKNYHICRVILIGKEPDLKSGDASRHCRFESCVRRYAREVLEQALWVYGNMKDYFKTFVRKHKNHRSLV